MKLNNRGWGLQELIVGIGILFFCLAFVSILIHNSFGQLLGEKEPPAENETVNPPINNSEPEYQSYVQIEKAMVEAAKKYNETIYGDELLEGDKISATMRSLVRDGYLKQVKDIKDDSVICSGYVTFIKENGKVTYTPYLKCGKYTSKGYLERLDADME